MIRFALPTLLALACTLPCAAQGAEAPADAAAFVLPGDYAQGTSLAELEARFGKANVHDLHAPGEDGVYHGVVLFPDDPSRRAYVEFYEDAPPNGVHAIRVRDRDSKWRGKRGVHVGMSLAELRAANGKPFYFSGFDAEGRGIVHDAWSPALDDDDGSLGKLDVDEGEHMYFEVELGLRASAPADAVPTDEASVSSDDPRYPRLGELVEVTGFAGTTSLDDEWE
ncbi:MAG: hypothetical protein QM719_12740 [Thermomonas sp.]